MKTCVAAAILVVFAARTLAEEIYVLLCIQGMI